MKSSIEWPTSVLSPPYSFTRMLSYDSDAGWRVLFPVVLPDFHTADFPADGFGELINKFDDTRVFVGSRHFLHMVLQLLDKLFSGGVP